MPSRSGEPPIRIASRGSALALWQAGLVRDALLASAPGRAVEIEVIRTTGDRILDVPLSRIGERGLFTKEIDATLLEERADLAVHSMKDVPTVLPEGLEIAAITRREDARDVIVLPEGSAGGLDALPRGARIGTSSLRRRAQLWRLRPDAEVADLRGNLDTRLARLDSGEYHAIILAAAGLLRLGLGARISEYLPPARWLPAPGQGALAIVARSGAEDTRAALAALHHTPTASAVRAERAVLHALEGGCQVPIGALGNVEGGELVLDALVADLQGTRLVRTTRRGSPEQAEELGEEAARELAAAGASTILEEIRRGQAPPVPAP